MTAAVLHIGTVKTGSTALQMWLSANPEILRGHGYHVSRSAGHTNHAGLVAFAQADGARDDVRARFGIGTPDDLARFRNRLIAELDAEVERAGALTFLFSSEFCHARLQTLAEIQALHALLGRWFDAIKVIVYLRRQDRVAVSGYTTLLATGGIDAAIIPSAPSGGSTQLDYFTTLDRWARVFGDANLSIRLYDDAMRERGSVIGDFCDQLGFTARLGDQPRVNVSLKPPHQELLRQLNLHWRDAEGGGSKTGIGEIARLLKKFGAGPGRLPDRAAAEALYDRYRASNEALRQRWFPDRATLFDESFDDYPEHSAVPVLDAGTLLPMVAELWSAVAEERTRMMKELVKSRREIARLQSLVDGKGGRDPD